MKDLYLSAITDKNRYAPATPIRNSPAGSFAPGAVVDAAHAFQVNRNLPHFYLSFFAL